MIEAEHPQDPKLPPGKPSPRDGTVLLFLTLFGLLFSWSSWQRDFSDPDECLFAVIAGNMEAGSGWIVPRFAGEPFLELPPLAGWLAALLHRATGLDPLVSYRLPVTLAAVFGLWLTYCAGKKLFDGRVGFLALLIQASTYFYFRRSSWLDDDLYFAVSCQLALTAFALATRKGAGPLPGMLGWLGLAGAALSKSALLAFVLVFGPLLFFLFLEGGLSAVTRGFRKMRSRRGILLFLLVAAPWYVAAGWKTGAELFDAHVLRGHLSRVLDSPIDKQLPSFYLIHLLLEFLPWTLFLPLGLLHAKDRLQRDGERLGLTWALFTLLSLTFVSAKRPGYILFVWPPLALLIAAGFFELGERFSIWEELLREGLLKLMPVILKLPAFLVAVLAAAYFTGYHERLSNDEMKRLLEDRTGVLYSLALLGGAAALVFAYSYRIRRLLEAKEIARAAFDIACATAFLFFVATFLYPVLNAHVSSRPAMERFAAQVPADAPLAVYGEKRPSFFHYLGRRGAIPHLDYPSARSGNDPAYSKVKEYLEQPVRSFFVTSMKELNVLKGNFPALGSKLHLVDEARVGSGETYVLASNRKE